MNRIELQHVTYTYAHAEAPALRDVTLSVASGEVKLVTGASGCGKTTIMRLANGLAPQILGGRLEGKVSIDGLDASETPVALLSEHIGTLFQDPEEQFFALNVRDEVAFALQCRGLPREEIGARVERAAETLGIAPLLGQSILTLSEGEKQKVGLAAILALGPQALVLDEPSANLDPESTESLARTIGELKRRGSAILIVDHRLYWLKDVVDEVLVMSEGRIAARGPFEMLRDEPLRRRYGLRLSCVDDVRRTLPHIEVRAFGEPLERGAAERLRVESLRFAHPDADPIFEGVSFAVPEGITALIGPNGSGKTTLARILTGLHRAEGRFEVDGDRLAARSLMSRAGLVLQNADHQLQMRTVREEVAAAVRAARLAEAKREKKGLLSRISLAKPNGVDGVRADKILRSLRLEGLSSRHPQSLSGGEKQRLVIGCAIAKSPSILVLDEPTSGLDGENMRVIADILRSEASAGRAVFLITHDLELLARSDRALDMEDAAAACRRSRSRISAAMKGSIETSPTSF